MSNEFGSASDEDAGQLSFAVLDAKKGFIPPSPLPDPDDPLTSDRWYWSIYTKQFKDLTDDDLSRLSIQDWYPEYFVPLSLERLQENPFINVHYEGQLLINIGKDKSDFLREHPQLLSRYCFILNAAINQLQDKAKYDEDLRGFIFEDGTVVNDDTRAVLLELQTKSTCA